MKRILLPGSIVVVALAITGCASKPPPYVPSVNTVSNANTSAQIKRIVDRRVDTDPYLSQLLCMTEIRESTTNDGYKRIQVFLKNLSGNTFWVTYRFNWYDENGVEVENPDDELWKRKIIATGDDVSLTSVAPKKNCKDFKLRMKVTE